MDIDDPNGGVNNNNTDDDRMPSLGIAVGIPFDKEMMKDDGSGKMSPGGGKCYTNLQRTLLWSVLMTWIMLMSMQK